MEVELTPPALHFQDVAATLGRHPIWSGATFALPAGALAALIGPNGSGKTTLLRIVLGTLAPSAGRVEVFGAPPRRGNRWVSLVPQRSELLDELALRARDLVMLGLTGHRWGLGLPSREEHARVEAALAAVDALAFADLPVGWLSGGQQKRLLIAQGLVHEAALLLLDEPFANLDLKGERELVALPDPP
ncbi:MAG: hypothetical protein KatS3mg061_0301 [Dehalococcoidia bacterium]|nr:MAG: hypothetical protein KatS3mg061_0301 [Dehalococcoidia bacterium]